MTTANPAKETVQIEVSRRLFRAVQYRPFAVLVSGLTGVSVTFVPYFLFEMGREGASFWDWRVLVCFAIIYLVPMVFMHFGGPVMEVAWKRRDDPSFGKPSNGAPDLS